MCLYLVDSRRDPRALQQLLGFFQGEVADPDALGLSLLNECFHCGPGVRNRDISDTNEARSFVGWERGFCRVGKCDRPVHLPTDLLETAIIKYDEVEYTRYRSM